MKKRITAIILLSMMVMLVSCSEKMVTDSRLAMGTLVTVTLPESDSERMDDIFTLVYSLDRELSRYTPGSWIYRINSSAGVSPVTVPPGIFSLISESVDMAYRTDGVFNPAIGPLTLLWGMGTESARVPEESEIEAVLPLLDYREIELDEENLSVYLPRKGMSLDLGAVGKGYASDIIHRFLEDEGIKHAIVNLGGNVLAHGGKPDGTPWQIAIRNPEGDASSYSAVVDVFDGTVITSGGYQRYIEKDGVRYHHILDSSTGYPFRSDILSATVVNPSGTLGDMLSTIVFSEGSEKAAAIAEEYGVTLILTLEGGEVVRIGEE